MVALLKHPEFMTVAEFLAWDAPPGARWQLINGVPQVMAPASGTHAIIQAEVGRLIGNHLVEHRPGCRVLANPGVVPRLESDENFRIPDLGVVCTPILRGVVEVAEPVLLIEILSPGNPAQTWINVWSYTSIASVQEIVVIRSTSIGVQRLRRFPDGTWPDVAEAIDCGELALQSIGFRVPVTALYAGTWLTEPA
jgi:Uma2 family endonuclease